MSWKELEWEQVNGLPEPKVKNPPLRPSGLESWTKEKLVEWSNHYTDSVDYFKLWLGLEAFLCLVICGPIFAASGPSGPSGSVGWSLLIAITLTSSFICIFLAKRTNRLHQ